MPTVNDCKRLLDNGWTIMLRRNGLGSYTAVAISANQDVDEALDVDRQITDDFEPSDALSRLAEKMIGNVVGEK